MTSPFGKSTRPRALVAHPSAELYGSDRQLLETVGALVAAGWDVDALLPSQGELAGELATRGARVAVVIFPVLRKSLLAPRALPGLLSDAVRSVLGARRLLRRTRPDVVLVNTLTIPEWLVAARLAHVPALCHVHEAEEDQPAAVRFALAAPLLFADEVVANSSAAAAVLEGSVRGLGRRTRVVHNGVRGPAIAPTAPRERHPGDPVHLALVGRLSPRKGIDVAVDAVRLLVERGHDVTLRICGTPFAGYEWYEENLREQVVRSGLEGRVDLAGYVSPTWPVLEAADIVLVPSRVEPFGNTAVEALLAERPLVASRTQGLREVVQDGTTGLLVDPDSPEALADGIARLACDDALARRLASAGRADAERRFSVEAYSRALLDAISRTAAR
ncbi:glycosyltransferase family 4 protein [Cellulomonas sp. JH27-2]|uniref:glycosyltransferase family 4 protein n=1 Tax=Cellulomonas sp. JH27-2 TaxID=2774139 RepID=UPI00351BDA42